MSLPLKAIERLFERLTLTYGRRFMDQWDMLGDEDIGKLKTLWSHELSPYASRLYAIAWALENLPPKPPNLIEFKTLCHMAPRPPEQALPEPKADPARLAAELAKLADVKKAVKDSGGYDGKAWAKRLLDQHKAGYKVRPICLRFAREALRLHIPQGGA